jgi:glycosyltransferase involved in cell wall biosynthesis
LKPRILAITDLFPSTAQPTLGMFVETSWRHIASESTLDVALAVPNGIAPFPFRRHPRYRGRLDLPLRESWNGLAVHRPRYGVLPRIGWRLAPDRMTAALRPLARGRDVLVGDYLFPAGIAAARLAAEVDCPLMLRAYGSDVHFWGGRRGARDRILRACDRAVQIFTVSQSLADELIALGVDAGRVQVQYAGVDLELFRFEERSAAKAALGMPEPLALCVGHLVPRKRFELAIRAAALIPSLHLRIVGEGPERDRLAALIRGARLHPRVQLLGALAHNRIPRLMAAADVLVLPSKREGLANVTLEALACGTPVVVTPVEGAQELLAGNAGGRIVEARAEAIAAAITELLAHPPDRADLRSMIAERFSWARHVAQFKAALGRIGLG